MARNVADVSRAERRAKAQVETEPMWMRENLTGYGVAKVPDTETRWFAYKCGTDGNVHLLTPLFDGQLRGEGKANAVARLKLALVRFVGGIADV